MPCWSHWHFASHARAWLTSLPYSNTLPPAKLRAVSDARLTRPSAADCLRRVFGGLGWYSGASWEAYGASNPQPRVEEAFY